MAMTEDEIISHMNKHMTRNWPRGGHWVAKGGFAEFVYRKSGQVLTAMSMRKAALLVGELMANKGSDA